MTVSWRKSHILGGIECYEHETSERMAVINGIGKQWFWRAVYWNTDTPPQMVFQEGEAVSSDSAKEDVKRWFDEVTR